METEKEVTVISKIDRDSGAVTLSFRNEKWGPVVTGKDLPEAREKFLKALRIALMVRSVLATNDLFKNNKLGPQTTMEVIDTAIKEYKTVEEEIAA